MKPIEKVEYTLVWDEEQEKLCQYAELVPIDGTIVEIGTAQGGTAKLFYNVTHHKKVKIFTIDINPLKCAYSNLKNTDVTIVSKRSSDFAQSWKHEVNRPIDLLFIDGNHNFQHVYEDFCLWIPYLKPGGAVVFHDYDYPKRGGIVHFGVKVCLDTILKLNILSNVKHEYKLLFGLLDNKDNKKLCAQDCFETLIDIGHNIRKIREDIFSKSMKLGLNTLQNRTINLDSLTACYCIDFLLKNDLELLTIASHSVNEFRKWSESLSIFEHCCGQFIYPDNISSISPSDNVVDLSRLIAKEQIRITMLSMVLKTVVYWDP